MDNEELHNPKTTADGDHLYESDMMLTEDQAIDAYGDDDLRAAIEGKNYRWHGGKIHYLLSAESEPDADDIREAMDHWSKVSCVKFKKLHESINGPHLLFARGTGACASHVGKISETIGQPIYIAPQCKTKGTIMHELAHALGLFHEQTRPDRDDYIKIIWEHMIPSKEGQFKMRKNIQDYGTPYDYDSIMHYGAKGGSKDGKITIVTLNPLKQSLIGQRRNPSFYDIKQINLMYKCAAHCAVKIKCKKGGYQDKHCKCICKKGYSGPKCGIEDGDNYETRVIPHDESTESWDSDVPQDSWEDSSWKTDESDDDDGGQDDYDAIDYYYNYDDDDDNYDDYDDDDDNYVDYDDAYDYYGYYDYDRDPVDPHDYDDSAVERKNSEEESTTEESGSDETDFHHLSEANVLPELVCGEEVTTETEIKTPNHPAKIGNETSCTWSITAPEGKKLKLNFNAFDLFAREEIGDCKWELLEVREKDTFHGKIYCGNELENKSVDAGNKVFLFFQSQKGQSTGFSVNIEFV